MKTFRNFDTGILNEARKIKINPDDFSHRKKLIGISIDSSKSKDLDDGFMMYNRGDDFVLQISIADVSEFIKPSSLMWVEASKRIETEYHAKGNEPMLPRVICERKLSLLPNKETPAITLEFVFDKELKITGFDIFESMFFNKARFNHEQVSKIIRANDDLYPEIKLAYFIATSLLNKRIENNELVVYDFKKKIYSDEEGNLISLNDKETEAYVLVQELMILANKKLSEFLAAKDIPIIFRNHTVRNSAPGRKKLIDSLKTGITNQTLYNQLLGKINLWFNKAFYSPDLEGHYALNAASYMHFTSPIRRFADLVNHYQLKAYLNSENFFTKKELNIISSSINAKLLEKENKQTDFFKQQAIKSAKRDLKTSSTQSLIEADDSNFKMILKLAMQSDSLEDNLEEAILHKIEQDDLGIYLLWLIMFAEKENPDNWNKIYESARKLIADKTGYANQLLYILMNKTGRIQGIAEDNFETINGFATRIVAIVNKRPVSTLNFAVSGSKKSAQNQASINFLFDLIDGKLVSENETIKPEINEVEQSEFEEPTENHLSEINNMYLRDKSWSKPEYFNELLGGTANKPIYNCILNIEIDGKTHKFSSRSNSKKKAKILCANEAWKRLMDEAVNSK